jgi:elongation factor G
MSKITTDRIRNIALLGHGGSGKTSLAEAMLYISGGTDRLGKIADGNVIGGGKFKISEAEEGKHRTVMLTAFITISNKICLCSCRSVIYGIYRTLRVIVSARQ